MAQLLCKIFQVIVLIFECTVISWILKLHIWAPMAPNMPPSAFSNLKKRIKVRGPGPRRCHDNWPNFYAKYSRDCAPFWMHSHQFNTKHAYLAPMAPNMLDLQRFPTLKKKIKVQGPSPKRHHDNWRNLNAKLFS